MCWSWLNTLTRRTPFVIRFSTGRFESHPIVERIGRALANEVATNEAELGPRFLLEPSEVIGTATAGAHHHVGIAGAQASRPHEAARQGHIRLHDLLSCFRSHGLVVHGFHRDLDNVLERGQFLWRLLQFFRHLLEQRA